MRVLFFSVCFLCVFVFSSKIRPYKIDVDEKVLEDLKQRLKMARFQPHHLEGMDADWSYGMPVSYARELLTYWRDEFDWRAQEKALNVFPHFETEINNATLRFIHARSEREDATPLLFVHGWPGSILECTKIIPLLTTPTDPADPAFHVVCPSIPGFGFSDPWARPGFDQKDTALAFGELMQVLGYETYSAQGGDWGSVVASLLAEAEPLHCTALHLNLVPVMAPIKKGVSAVLRFLATCIFPSWFLEPSEVEPFNNQLMDALRQTGYFHQQATKPDTLGYGMHDSPLALMTWIVDKWYTWSDCSGNIENRFTKDELLTNVMIYWVTDSATTSLRYYKEFFEGTNAVFMSSFDLDVKVPTAVLNFPVEIAHPPKAFVSYFYNLVRWSKASAGGHFAALEEPQVLVSDIRAFHLELRSPSHPEL